MVPCSYRAILWSGRFGVGELGLGLVYGAVSVWE